MKKMILMGALCIISCSGDNDTINVVKNDLESLNLSKSELSQMKYSVYDATGEDVFNYAMKIERIKYKLLMELSNYDEASKSQFKLDSILQVRNQIQDLTFKKVIAYRINPDTVSKSIYFINSENKIHLRHFIK